MHGAVGDLAVLLRDGFDVQEIHTSDGVIHVRLRRGRLSVEFSLDREDASDLLASFTLRAGAAQVSDR